MNKKLFLISLVFLFSSFCFAEEKHNLAKQDSFSFSEERFYDLVIEGDLPAIKKLLEKYKDDKKRLINFKKNNDQAPLHYAVGFEHIEMLVFFIESEADLNTRDKWGMTALHYAVSGKKSKIAQMLLEAGADPNKTDKEGKTPLHYAVNMRDKKMVKILLQAKANPNKTDKQGMTSLHYAVDYRGNGVAKIFLEAGAEPYFEVDYRGNEMTKILVEFGGADPYLKNAQGEIFYDIAIRQEYSEIEKFLEGKRNQSTISASKCASAIN